MAPSVFTERCGVLVGQTLATKESRLSLVLYLMLLRLLPMAQPSLLQEVERPRHIAFLGSGKFSLTATLLRTFVFGRFSKDSTQLAGRRLHRKVSKLRLAGSSRATAAAQAASSRERRVFGTLYTLLRPECLLANLPVIHLPVYLFRTFFISI